TETEREGIEFVYLVSPTEVLADANGRVRGVVFIRNKLGEPDEKGRRSPVAIPGTEFEIPCDTVLLALGQAPETSWLSKEFPEFRVKRWRDIKVDPETYQTIVPKIFIGGDYRTAPTTIIEAVADGRSAAQQIARFLDENAVSGNVPEYHEVVTRGTSSTTGRFLRLARPRSGRTAWRSSSTRRRASVARSASSAALPTRSP